MKLADTDHVPLEIREALIPEERLAVYRFRYRIYVEEMGRAPEAADHERGILTSSTSAGTCSWHSRAARWSGPSG